MASASGDGFLGLDQGNSGSGRFQPVGSSENYADAEGGGPNLLRPDNEDSSAVFSEPIGPPQGVTASVQGDHILRALLPLPIRVMVQIWPYVVTVALFGSVVIIFVLHNIWGSGHAYKRNVIEPANQEFCSKPYDWYRNGDVTILIPLIALPEVLRLRRFCLHSNAQTFSAPLADLYSSVSLLTPESWQRSLYTSAKRCAFATLACIAAFIASAIPVLLSSSLLHYPNRLQRLKGLGAECGTDWWFGQVPDIFLVCINLPIAALIFVPYFVILHGAEGVRLSLQAYAAEFELRVSQDPGDETAMAETVKKHQALELLLEHAQVVLEPALRWLLLFGTAMVLALLTYAWMELSAEEPAHSLALFLTAMVFTLTMVPLLRRVERINAFQTKLEKLAFTVADPAALGSALPATISNAAMLREYVREHALSLPVGGLVIRPDSLVSSSSLLSVFCLIMVRASSLSARARASEQTQLVPPSAAGHLMFTPRLTQAHG